MDLKYNLLLSYATYLTFYLLLRVDGATNDTVRDHPVLFKITTLKKTLDGLRGMDEKLERALRRKLKGKGFEKVTAKKNEREEEDEKIADDEEDQMSDDEEDIGSYGDQEDGEEDMEDEDMDDDNVVDTDALLTKSE